MLRWQARGDIALHQEGGGDVLEGGPDGKLHDTRKAVAICRVVGPGGKLSDTRRMAMF